MNSHSPLKQRRAGLLLHPTSLPNMLGRGDFGPDAYRFVEFMAAGGMGVWQILPLCPPHAGDSPYLCLSGSAGNPLLISLELLRDQGWLSRDASTSATALSHHAAMAFRREQLVLARSGFMREASVSEQEGLASFIVQHGKWLDDYALYQALRQKYGYTCWTDWPVDVRDRKPEALNRARLQLQDSVAQTYFEQFVFFRQWHALKDYANARGVKIFGDMPIFVAHDSVDVWAMRHYFALDDKGLARLVSGVPPDYFSPEGQHWGHPHYRWDVMEGDGFQYWIDRMKVQLEMFDMVRIDHFRGFESYWEIPASSTTAKNGHWQKAPGDQLFYTLEQHFGPLPMVAEDLGMITPEVLALRDKYNFPGMTLLQFSFDGSAANPYVPYKHESNSVVYTGTHDNDTTVGWFNSLDADRQNYVVDYLGNENSAMPWPLIRCAFASVAQWAIIPMQDILMLDNDDRMNVPGTTSAENWQWTFAWDEVPLDMAARLRHLSQLYGRCA